MKVKSMSMEEAFMWLKIGHKIYRESFLEGDYYFLDEDGVMRYYNSSKGRVEVGILSFLNPIDVDDWVAEDE